MKRRTIDREIPLVGYTLEEASAAMRTHPQTLARLFRDGEIPARKHGRGWLVHPEALEVWLKKGRGISSLSQEVGQEDPAEAFTYTAASGEQVALDELRAGLLTIQEQLTILVARGHLSEKELPKLQYLSDMIGIFIPEASAPVEEAEDLENE